jgi:hypothetical protein
MPRLPEREQVPDDVEITSEPRTPVWDSTVGVEVAPKGLRGTPRNRLVTIGDSLTHGFQSGAIYNTDLSYPAIIAHELGWYDEFRHPHYPGFGGIPLNLEVLVAELEHHFGDKLSWWELPSALYRVRQHLAQAEQWWDDGPGAALPKEREINHNLGIYGWDLRDALSRTADTAEAEWRVPSHWRVVPLIRNADSIAAIRVLHSARDKDHGALTPLEAAAALGDQGVEEGPDEQGDPGDGIETLIVLLGANNALGSVISLTVRWSGEGYENLRDKAKYNVWRPTHFKVELDRVATMVRGIRARHVIWGTVPHVTIAPVARGVQGKVEKGSRFFKFYTRPWISDRDFNPDEDHPYLIADDARAIDSAIDQYNATIVETVAAGRKEGRDWRLLDLAGFLDRLAARRYIDDPFMEPPEWWSPYPLPDALRRLDPLPDSRFFASGAGGRTAGGLFSLDGIHPTTIAYGLMAQEFINVMVDAGVIFYDRAGQPRTAPVTVDFETLVRLDTLISHPPRSLGSDVALIGSLDQRLDVISRLWAGIG